MAISRCARRRACPGLENRLAGQGAEPPREDLLTRDPAASGKRKLYQADPLVKEGFPRVVTLDIETAPLVSYTWDIWDQNVGLDQIHVEWSIISFSAKWLGEKAIIYRDTGGNGPNRIREDKPLLRELWAILDQADIVIAQNGVKFDLKKINARLLMHGFTPYSPIKVVDTMLIAKRHFAFTSNKLAWMSEHLTTTKKDDHHRFPGFKLWDECMKDNPAAWAEMRKYNIRDVVATEELYLRLRPWMVGHPNVAAYMLGEEVRCPKCGSSDVQKRGTVPTQTGEYTRIRCNSCGGWSRTRYTENSLKKRHALLSN